MKMNGLMKLGIVVPLLSAGITFASPPASDTNCQADNSWFPHSETPMPDSANFSPNSNCSFHRWAWQMFLWLTQEDNNQPRFLNFQSPYDVLGIKDRESLLPRLSKSGAPRSLDEYLQAGTEGILIDQSGKAVYYSQYLNDTFVSFIDSNKLTDPKVVQNFDPNTPFPVDSLELKASWKIVDDKDKYKSFFTMPSTVFKLINKDGSIVVDDTRPIKVTLALVGFHIAGVVKDHPEMIWATFEHKDNAPDVPADVTPSQIISKKDWTFYKANTPYSDCNVNPASSPVLKLDEKTQTLSPITHVCRRYAFGNDANQKDMSVPTNIKVVKQLNDSVLSQLSKSDVWSNYFEVGAIWFARNKGLKPNMSLATDSDDKGQLLIGSLKLSNSTVETFTQTQSTMNNCFRCHNTLHRFPPSTELDPLPGLNLNISHAFVNIYFWSQELSQEKDNN
ncbi:hypothetical protein [Pleionea sediminis]|uniref:hypothetical protein n=1 Tax=Pleionea sediminis TaxID=2569479 RepID=UPI001185F6CD|nr:hypothetical protein [Pleionea sediminis]